jgi:hypothetical protein
MIQQIRLDGSDPRSSTSSDNHKGRVFIYLEKTIKTIDANIK